MEQLKYAGLRIEDKAALLDAKAKGAEWVARDSDSTGMICGFHNKPRRFTDGEWITDDGFVIGFRQTLRFVKAKSAEPVNIDAALLQIAEMERAVEEGRQVMESLEKDSVTVIKDAYSLSKPRTHQDALLEKWRDVDAVANLLVFASLITDGYYHVEYLKDGNLTIFLHTTLNEALEAQRAWLLSPAEDGK